MSSSPIPPRRCLRPRKATSAGRLLIIPSAVCLVIWSTLLVFGLLILDALVSPDNGGPGLDLQPEAYLIILLPYAFWGTAIVVGVLVMRGVPWARVPAIVVAILAALAGAASVIALLYFHTVPLLVASSIYIALNYRAVHLLMSPEVGTWCQQS